MSISMQITAATSAATATSIVAAQTKDQNSKTEMAQKNETQVSLCDSLYPRLFLAGRVQEEDTMVAIAKLILNNAKKVASALARGQFSDFDPLVGDEACETRAYKVYMLSTSQALLNEAKEISAIADKILKEINDRPGQLQKRNRVGISKYVEPSDFFQANIEGIKVSPELAYLMQCHLLAIAKVTKQKDISTNPNVRKMVIIRTFTGAEAEVNDFTEWKSLSRLIDNKEKRKALHLANIGDWLKLQLAKRSLQCIWTESLKLQALTPKEIAVIQDMMKVTFKEDRVGYRCFHTYKTIMMRLREQQALVMVKEMIPCPDIGAAKVVKEPMEILYRPAKSGGPFEPVTANDRSVYIGKPVIVLEAAIKPGMSAEAVAKAIDSCKGLYEVILANAATVEDTSTITNKDALEEVLAQKKEAEAMGYKVTSTNPLVVTNPFLLLDHVYCSTVQAKSGANS